MNVHEFETVGNEIIEKMIGKPVFGISFKQKDWAKTLADDSDVKVAKEQTIDPALLFQRFLIRSLEEVMSYELCSFPAHLFEGKEIFRKANKLQLVQAVTEFSSKKSNKTVLDSIPPTEHHLLEDGSLVQRLAWKRGDSYGAIAQSYADSTICIMVKQQTFFDGYSEDPSIKDNTHQRLGANTHPIVKFNAETEFVGRKDDFLTRSSNKQGLFNLMTNELEKKGCTVINASGDAEVDIVEAAVEASEHQPTTLIGDEDTDLLVLLLYYAGTSNRGPYFRSDKSKATKV